MITDEVKYKPQRVNLFNYYCKSVYLFSWKKGHLKSTYFNLRRSLKFQKTKIDILELFYMLFYNPYFLFCRKPQKSSVHNRHNCSEKKSR